MRLTEDQLYLKSEEVNTIRSVFHHRELLKRETVNIKGFSDYIMDSILTTLQRQHYLSWNEIIFMINVARKTKSMKKFQLYLNYYLICRNQETIQRSINSDLTNNELKASIELEKMKQIGLTVDKNGNILTVKVFKYQIDIMIFIKDDFHYKSVNVYNYYLSFFSQYKLRSITSKKSMKRKIEKLDKLSGYSTKTSYRLFQKYLNNIAVLDTEFLSNTFNEKRKRYTTSLIEIGYVTGSIDLLDYKDMSKLKIEYSKNINFKDKIVKKTFIPNNFDEITSKEKVKVNKSIIASDLKKNISEDTIVFIWGSEDINVLRNEFRNQKVLKNRKMNFIDIQPLFSFAMANKGYERKYSYGLKNAVEMIEEFSDKKFNPEGNYHNALVDSKATLFILEYLAYTIPYESYIYIDLMIKTIGF